MGLMTLRRDFSLFPTPDQIDQIDFSDHSTLAPAVWAVNVTFIVLVIVVVGLRIYARACITRQLFADDHLAILAAACLFVSCVVSLIATKYGLGQHVWNIPLPLSNILEQTQRCVQLMVVTHVFYALATAFAKISIITSYLRIFPNEWLRRILFVTAVVVVGIGVSAIFATIFQCKPIAAAWDFSISRSKCYHFVDFLYAKAAINIATDFVICLGPLPCFWHLRIPVRQKLVVSFLFCIGFVACVISIVRIAFLHELEGIDVTYNLVTTLNWTVIECSLAIICVSVPPMRPLLSRLVPNFFPAHLSGISRGFRSHKGSRGLSGAQRTQDEVLEEMNRELDRQLMELGRTADDEEARRKKTHVAAMSILERDGDVEEVSTVELTGMAHHRHCHETSGTSEDTFDFIGIGKI